MKTLDNIILAIIGVGAIILISAFYLNKTEAYNYNYTYNGTQYVIDVPENIEYLENKVMIGECDMRTYGCKVAKLNIMLVTAGYPSLYSNY